MTVVHAGCADSPQLMLLRLEKLKTRLAPRLRAEHALAHPASPAYPGATLNDTLNPRIMC